MSDTNVDPGSAPTPAPAPSPTPAPAPAPSATATPAPAPSGDPSPSRDRDAHGRFAPKTNAAGGEPAAEPAKSVWPEDWRERMAAQVGGTDEKAVAKELKRLQRMNDPTSVYGSFRELDSRFAEGGLVKKPGKDAKPEDVQAFYRAMGVPEKPEDYFTNLQLGEGKVLGEADKPIFEGFTKAAHAAGYTPQQTSAAVSWYLGLQEEQAAAQFKEDETFRQQANAALNDAWGSARSNNVAAIKTLFVDTPGGADPDNENSLMARLLGGRTSDGRVIGDDPEINKWLSQRARDINPAASIVGSGGGDAKSIDTEIAELESYMRTNRRDWFKDETRQARHRELIAARERIQARSRAA